MGCKFSKSVFLYSRFKMVKYYLCNFGRSVSTKDGSTLRHVYNLRTMYFTFWSVPYQRTVLQFYFVSVPYLRTVPKYLRTVPTYGTFFCVPVPYFFFKSVRFKCVGGGFSCSFINCCKHGLFETQICSENKLLVVIFMVIANYEAAPLVFLLNSMF